MALLWGEHFEGLGGEGGVLLQNGVSVALHSFYILPLALDGGYLALSGLAGLLQAGELGPELVERD